MLEIKLADRFRLKDGFVLHQIPDLEKYWLFDLGSGDQYGLNEVGMFVLQLLRHGATFEELVCSTLERYRAANNEVEEDIKEFLVQLLLEGIILAEESD